MRAHAALALLAVAAFAAASAGAEPAARDDTVQLDSARSHAQFRVKVMWLIGIQGSFGSVRGSVDVDRFRSRAVVDAYIDVDKVHMNVRGYEDWVKSPEFFDAAAHPEIHFVSEPFALKRLHDGGELPGTLTLRGVSREVSFTLAPATCAQPGYDCPIVATGTIGRSQFGMRSRLGTVGDRVSLGFSVFAIRSAARLSR